MKAFTKQVIRAGIEQDSDALVNCAITTGELYDRHCRLAHAKAPEEEWRQHVLHFVIPTYRRDFGGQVDRSFEVSHKAARELKQYYEQHVREVDESDVDDAVSAIIKAPKLDAGFIKDVKAAVEAPTSALEYRLGNIAAGFCLGLVTGVLLGGYIAFLIIAK